MRRRAGSSNTPPPNPLAEWLARAGLGDDVRDALVTWLLKQFMSDLYAKLEQGSHQEGGVPLRRVFVDLPISPRPTSGASDGERRFFLRTLFEQKPVYLCPHVEHLEGTEEPEPVDDPFIQLIRRGKGFAVIGGPGQGKSTLGQLACQMHRAALLAPFVERFQPVQQEVVRSFTDAATKKELGQPSTPLLPIHIVLPEATAWLTQRAEDAEPPVPQLLTWLAEKAATRGASVSVKALLALLVHAPLLLVLDGLDEVGAAEDRALLVEALRDLITTLAASHARGIVVAATRPQGYAGELESIGVPLSTVYLDPLQQVEALAYGKKLAQEKLPTRTDDQERVLRGLKSAADDPATARLLTTPLQVTIMVALVQRMGKPPSERWSLFKRYFETIYDREVERETYAASLLRDHRAHIVDIHARVGLLLQVESERVNAGEPRMSRERLEAVAHAVLAEDDVDAEMRAKLVARIVRAAEERLVFLVEPEPGRFGFEVRSLQEFMAAWALAADGDALTEERLVHIAKAPMFRAVTLFLASKLFSERSPLREKLADAICRRLDEDPRDDASRETRAGGMLALEILEEGSTKGNPRCTKQLMERACGLLDLPPCHEQARLASVGVEDAARLLEAAARERLKLTRPEKALGSWVAVAEAAGQGRPWATEVGRVVWDSSADSRPLLFARAHGNDSSEPISPWLAELIKNSPAKVPPAALRSMPLRRLRQSTDDWLAAFMWMSHFGSDHRIAIGPDMKVYGLGVEDSSAESWRPIAAFSDPPSPWLPWVAAARFVIQPSAATLADALRALSSPESWIQRLSLADYVPWPLAACLRSAESRDDLVSFASLADAGELGDVDEWSKAERGWMQRFDLRTFVAGASRPLPWTRSGLTAMPPLGAGYLRPDRVAPRGASLATLRAVDRIPCTTLRAHLLPSLLSWLALELGRSPVKVSWGEVERWVEGARELSGTMLSKRLRSASTRDALLDGLDRLGRRRTVVLDADGTLPLVELFELYCAHPERQGLIYWLRDGVARYEPMAMPVGRNFMAPVMKAMSEHPIVDGPLQADAALVRVWLGGVASAELDIVLDTVARYASSEPVLWSYLLDAIRWGVLPDETQEALLAKIMRHPERSEYAAVVALRTLRRSLQTRRTDLANPATWSRLRLPKPLPLSDSSAQQAFSLPDAPVSLSRIELKNIRGIADLTLDLAPPAAAEQGQWTVILGPNGAGKTTLLRAVTLALRNLSDPKIWPRGTFATPWRSNRGGPGPSLISTTLAGGTTFRVTVQRNGSESFAREPKDHPTPFPVFAYGCRRGSALGGALRALQLGEDDGPEIATLFDEGAPLIHAETWIKEWDGAAAREPAKYAAAYEAVRAALQKLLAVDEVIIRDRQVLVTGPVVGTNVPFAALSDGYLTTAGWFLDLVARWIDLALKYKHPAALSADLLALMTGLVLLDEIDLHLHPRWQIEVIPRVKKLLPRMSFIVTTHNPLTLVGARPEEIWILSADGGEVRAERGAEAPMLLTGGQIYSRYFGIQDIYPHEIGEALRRYGFLSGDPRRTEEEQVEMEGLRKKLHEHGIEPGWEEVPREVTRARGRAPRAKRTSR